MKKNYELEYKLCTNDLLGKVQINSFERVYNWLYNAYIWLRKRTRQNKTFLIVQVYFDYRVVTRYMGSGIKALGIGISVFSMGSRIRRQNFVGSGIKIFITFGIRD